tara:strand:+ start:529 stop:780 length:252 start_codon:yes stop_codon:yes gene_type:complete
MNIRERVKMNELEQRVEGSHEIQARLRAQIADLEKSNKRFTKRDLQHKEIIKELRREIRHLKKEVRFSVRRAMADNSPYRNMI